MYRYVARVRDTIKLGFNGRKRLACQREFEQHSNDLRNKSKEASIEPRKIQFLPSETHEEFRKKYNCKHPNNCNKFIQAITWSTALIAGFYASQLICLYRRNHRLDPKKCCYTKYFCLKNQQFHKNFLFAERQCKSSQFSHDVDKYNKTYTNQVQDGNIELYANKREKVKFVNFSGVKIFEKRFQKYYSTLDNDNDGFNRGGLHENIKRKDEVSSSTQNDTRNNEIEGLEQDFVNISHLIGELELQLGIECIQHSLYEEAIEHFKIATNLNNSSACYNLALLYENGLGVRVKDMVMAKRLYQLAGKWDHKGALYNLGVFFAKGLGGTRRNFQKAKLCFEKAAILGEVNARAALEMIHPSQRKISCEPDDFISEDHDSEDKFSLIVHS